MRTSAPALLPAQVATALGIRLSVGDPVTALVDALRDRQLLLVMDNCEHLLDAAALLLGEVHRHVGGVGEIGRAHV